MNLFSTNDRKTDLKIRITRARYNMIFIVLMSVINIFLIISKSTMLMPYSSAISNYSVTLGISESLISGTDTFRIFGLIVACAVLMIIMVCYLLSKTKPLYMFIALSIIAADTIALAVIEAASGTLASPIVILDIVAHGLAVFSIISGVKAFKELKSLPEDDEKKAIENPAINIDAVFNENNIENSFVEDEYEEMSEEIDNDPEDEEDLSQPIGKYVDDGTEPLVQGAIVGLKVFVVIRNNIAELIINNYVCDELNVEFLSEFQLRTFVNDIEFSFDYKETESGKIMYLYADDELLDSLGIG